MTTGAHVLAQALAQARAFHLFTLSGNQIMPLYDPLVAAGVAPLHVRHEAAAVHMADAYARLTELPCPVLLTAGPGHTNALTALYVAQMAESPVVLLSGASEAALAGSGAFQEVDQAGLAKRVAKAAWTARDPARLGADLARAYRIANEGRPGPVSVSLPADVLRASAAEAEPPPLRAFASRRRAARAARVGELLKAIRGAKRPLLIGGPAMSRGKRWRALSALADALGVPALPMESPRGPNDPTFGGIRAMFPKTDLVVPIGRRIDYALGFGQPPLFAPDVGWHRVDYGEVDPAVVAAQALAEVDGEKARGDGGWRREVEAARGVGREGWDALARSDARPIHPLRVAREACALLGEGDVFAGDGGEFGQWAQAGGPLPGCGVDRVVNGPSGAIGGAIPFAIGAQVARPGKRVVAFVGDGAAGYHLSELHTAVQHGLNVVVVVGNDASWNAEVQIQKQLGGRELAALRLDGARYDLAAAAFGAHGELVTRPDELAPALRRALSTRKPALLDVRISPEPAPR